MEFKLVRAIPAARVEGLVTLGVPKGKYHANTIRVSLAQSVLNEAGILHEDRIILLGDTTNKVVIQAVDDDSGWKLGLTKAKKTPPRSLTHISAPPEIRALFDNVRATHVTCSPSKRTIAFKLEGVS